MQKQSHLNQHSLVLFDLFIGSYQVLPLWERVDLQAMTVKGYSAFPIGGGLTLLQRSSRCILQLQLTGQFYINCYFLQKLDVSNRGTESVLLNFSISPIRIFHLKTDMC